MLFGDQLGEEEEFAKIQEKASEEVGRTGW